MLESVVVQLQESCRETNKKNSELCQENSRLRRELENYWEQARKSSQSTRINNPISTPFSGHSAHSSVPLPPPVSPAFIDHPPLVLFTFMTSSMDLILTIGNMTQDFHCQLLYLLDTSRQTTARWRQMLYPVALPMPLQGATIIKLPQIVIHRTAIPPHWHRSQWRRHINRIYPLRHISSIEALQGLCSRSIQTSHHCEHISPIVHRQANILSQLIVKIMQKTTMPSTDLTHWDRLFRLRLP